MNPVDQGKIIYSGEYIRFYESGTVVIDNPQPNKLNIGSIVVHPRYTPPEEPPPVSASGTATPGGNIITLQAKQSSTLPQRTYPRFVSRLVPTDVTVESNMAIYQALIQAGVHIPLRTNRDEAQQIIDNGIVGLTADGKPQGLGVELHDEPLSQEGFDSLTYRTQRVLSAEILGKDSDVNKVIGKTLDQLFFAARKNELPVKMEKIVQGLQKLHEQHQESGYAPPERETPTVPEGGLSSRQRGHLRLIK